jgi:hypothetical protein
MQVLLKAGLICTSILFLASARADDDPLNDPAVQRTLRAMRDASTVDHPDLYGMTVGMQRYAHHQFHDALKHFEIGAYYADKPSQLCIGLMYMNGEGVQKDPVTAYAWLDLASERKYPDFIATRDRVKATLTPDQLAKAQALRVQLGERYGDAMAKHRMEVQLRVGLINDFTGSHVGFDSGISQFRPGPCGPLLTMGGHTLPQAGCDNGAYLAKSYWDPKEYFNARDSEWNARVTVGPVSETANPAAAPKDSGAAAGKDVTEPAKH